MIFQPFQGFALAERVERGVSHESAHAIRVYAGVGAQAPTDGFVDEKFTRAKVFQDDVFEEGEVCGQLVIVLEKDGDPTQPNVFGRAPVRESGQMFGGEALEVGPNKANRDCVDRIPPGFVGNKVFQGG